MVDSVENKEIKNIIFDFGGVFLNIDFKRTFSALEELCGKKIDELFPDGLSDALLVQLETGQVSPQEFRQRLRHRMGAAADDEAIDVAWNAMLLDLPTQRVEMLRLVAQNCRVFLLSNTNRIHYLKYNGDFRLHHGCDFDDLFEKAFWSHELGLRKPDGDCYDAVLKQAGLMAAETVFIDDSYTNVTGAMATGLLAIHLTGEVTDLFSDGRLVVAARGRG